MGINPKAISTDFTLEMDQERITAAEFARAVDGFFGLIKEVSKELFPARDKDGASWFVKVYSGSAGIGLLANPDLFTGQDVQTLRAAISEGLDALEEGEKPRGFTDKALGHIKTISHLSAVDGSMQIRLWDRNKPLHNMGEALGVRVTEILEPAYEADGSIDGFLERLNAHQRLEFVVYDVLSNRPVTCEVQEQQLEAAIAAFRKRVEVVGKIKYRRDGQAVSVKAKDIIPYPSKEAVPTPAEIRELLADA
jgi:hypothetical protein